MGHLNQLKKNAGTYGVQFVLIMVDGEGDMSASDKKERLQAAVAHRKWVDIAHYLGCHAIRCNMGGPRQDWKQDADLTSRAAESFNNLLEYARGAGLNIIIENHGGASSDPDVVVKLMKAVNNPNFGTLPDFGNINQGDDHAEVIRKIVPWAKGVSVKAMWAPDGIPAREPLPRPDLGERSQRRPAHQGRAGADGTEEGVTPRELSLAFAALLVAVSQGAADTLAAAPAGGRLQDALGMADSLLKTNPRDARLWAARALALGAGSCAR